AIQWQGIDGNFCCENHDSWFLALQKHSSSQNERIGNGNQSMFRTDVSSSQYNLEQDRTSGQHRSMKRHAPAWAYGPASCTMTLLRVCFPVVPLTPGVCFLDHGRSSEEIGRASCRERVESWGV